MFGSEMLDIIISLFFVYLLLSLICTAVAELIEHWLKRRAKDLERGIRQLLSDPKQQGLIRNPEKLVRNVLYGSNPQSRQSTALNEVTTENFYKHPLLRGLYDGDYTPSKSFLRFHFMRTTLPSYIPSKVFALALMDLVLPADSAANLDVPVQKLNRLINDLGQEIEKLTAGGQKEELRLRFHAVTGGTGQSAWTAGKLIYSRIKMAELRGSIEKMSGLPPQNQLLELSNNISNEIKNVLDNLNLPLESFRVAVDQMQNTELKRAILPLIDAAAGDIDQARKNIEEWYDSAMDRVSGWYKRHTQRVLLVLGFLVAIALNADSIAIATNLSKNSAVRDAVVAAALEYANNSTDASITAQATLVPNNTPLPASEPTATTNPYTRLESELEAVSSLGLPIGWDTKNSDTVPTGGGAWVLKVIGWLITTFAISLGAPFWFDLLNKFLAIRSTIKPKEKSPEEPSEDV